MKALTLFLIISTSATEYKEFPVATMPEQACLESQQAVWHNSDSVGMFPSVDAYCVASRASL